MPSSTYPEQPEAADPPTAARDAPAARRSGRHPGGRRRGESRTREEILAAARTMFAERGYDATSVRRIAEVASVDQSLVHHFYGTKENLFRHALDMPIRMSHALAAAVADGDRATLGERMVRAHFEVWRNATTAPRLMTMVRSATIHELAAQHLGEAINGLVREALADVITGDDADVRIGLVAAQLMGLSLTRHVLSFEPVVSADPETIVRRYGVAIQTLLDPAE